MVGGSVGCALASYSEVPWFESHMRNQIYPTKLNFVRTSFSASPASIRAFVDPLFSEPPRLCAPQVGHFVCPLCAMDAGFPTYRVDACFRTSDDSNEEGMAKTNHAKRTAVPVSAGASWGTHCGYLNASATARNFVLFNRFGTSFLAAVSFDGRQRFLLQRNLHVKRWISHQALATSNPYYVPKSLCAEKKSACKGHVNGVILHEPKNGLRTVNFKLRLAFYQIWVTAGGPTD